MQLVVTIASQGMKDIAGCALRVDSDQRGRGVYIPQHERERALGSSNFRAAGLPQPFKAQETEVCPTGREADIGDLSQVYQCAFFDCDFQFLQGQRFRRN